MQFNIYLEDELGKKIEAIIKKSGKRRNTVLREAISQWVERNLQKSWPESILNFIGEPNYVAPELSRRDLIEPEENKLF